MSVTKISSQKFIYQVKFHSSISDMEEICDKGFWQRTSRQNRETHELIQMHLFNDEPSV